MKRLYEVIKDDYDKWRDEEYAYEKVNGNVISKTFGDFVKGTINVAKTLLNKGYKDKYIIIFGDNSIKLMQIDLATLVYVGKSVVVSKEWKEDDLSYAISTLDAPVLLYGKEKEDIVKNIKSLYDIDYICFDDIDYDLEITEDDFKLIPNNYEDCCKIVFSSCQKKIFLLDIIL